MLRGKRGKGAPHTETAATTKPDNSHANRGEARATQTSKRGPRALLQNLAVETSSDRKETNNVRQTQDRNNIGKQALQTANSHNK